MSQESSLEAVIPEIRDLDSLRKQVQTRIADGLRGLLQKKPEKFGHDDGWHELGDLVGKALLRGAVSKEFSPFLPKDLKDKEEALASLENQLAEIDLEGDLFKEPADSSGDILDPAKDRVPVLRCAVVLHTLSAIPQSVLSKGAFSCLFRIIYALNYTSSSHQMIGGANAGWKDSPQSAFMTWRCVRAVQAFADAFHNTAQVVDCLIAWQKTKPLDPGFSDPEVWRTIHKTHAQFAADITLRCQKGRVLIQSETVPSQEEIAQQLQAAQKLVRTQIALSEQVKKSVFPQQKEKDAENPSQRPFEDEEFAKETSAFRKAQKSLHDLAEILGNSKGDLKELKKCLEEAAERIRDSVLPAEKFLRKVLDHELAVGTAQEQAIADTSELLFAADGLRLLGYVDEQVLRTTLKRVEADFSIRGRVRSHQPFDLKAKGYVLHVASAEVIQAFAELARHQRYPVSADTTRKINRHFADTWQNKAKGWRHERDSVQGKCQLWVSGLSIQVLGSVLRMLDTRINELVFQHFTVRRPDNPDLDLDHLFYPDYFFAAAKIRESAAKMLQHLRAHVGGVKGPKKEPHDLYDDLYSVVLHGPPGTGKTTLVEAVANSAKVPLVEVTPSDILLAGAEMVEGRARAVFEALSLLSDTVILFDEFDSILWDRGKRSESKGTMLEFLTPGMLPKLKNLHEKAKKQRIAFVLSTNRVGGLDKAAIREGRFDGKIGIYPPDALSREGRFLTALAETPHGDSKVNPDRVKVVLEKTAGKPMDRLGKKGWFSPDTQKPSKKCPMLYVLGECMEEDINWPSAEKDLKTPEEDYADILGEDKGEEPQLHRLAYREWMEWRLVEFMDKLGDEHKVKDVIQHMLQGEITKELKEFLDFDLEKLKKKKDVRLKNYKEKYEEFLMTLSPDEMSGDPK